MLDCFRCACARGEWVLAKSSERTTDNRSNNERTICSRERKYRHNFLLQRGHRDDMIEFLENFADTFSWTRVYAAHKRCVWYASTWRNRRWTCAPREAVPLVSSTLAIRLQPSAHFQVIGDQVSVLWLEATKGTLRKAKPPLACLLHRTMIHATCENVPFNFFQEAWICFALFSEAFLFLNLLAGSIRYSWTRGVAGSNISTNGIVFFKAATNCLEEDKTRQDKTSKPWLQP